MNPKSARRIRLLSGAALLLAAGTAQAQTYPDRAFQAESTVTLGSATFGRTPAADTIAINAAQTVINWNPETGPAGLLPAGTIDILPVGRTLTFTNAPGLNTPYIVLNRIIAPSSATRGIAINGSVTSTFGAVAGIPAPVGGTVWFYTPGGFVIGANARFNVGNLVLSANDIDTTGGLLGPTGEIRFRGAAGSTAAITVNPAALPAGQFILPNAGSYMAMVAPTVTMGGSANVNGSVAYVAAEQVDVRINAGLLDIAFLVGTDSANAITHTGTTRGPAQTTHGIFFAAMPKNTAISMLLGGTIGYTPAATAAVQNGQVVLSAGYGVTGGAIDAVPGSATAANIVLNPASYTSQVFARSNAALSNNATGALAFSSNATLGGDQSATLVANAAGAISVGGSLTLTSQRPGFGGTASLTLNNGNLTVGGDVAVSAAGLGVGSLVAAGGDGLGGQARLTINGGTAAITGRLDLTASGFGGGGPTATGDGTGGTAAIALNAGGVPSVLNANQIGITADGIGGGFKPDPAVGGDGFGGVATFSVASGAVTTIQTNISASAAASDTGDGGISGLSSAGTARLAVTGGLVTMNGLFVNADERQASAGLTAGATLGTGLAAVDVGGGTLNVGLNGGPSMAITANAIKSPARVGVPTGGGDLIAGTARMTASGGGTINTDATAPSAPKPPVLLSASVLFNDIVAGAQTTSQRGGTVIVDATGGTISVHKLDLRADALVRTAVVPDDPAGPSFGGTVTLAARDGGSITVRTGSGATPVSAFATGGSTNVPLLGTGGRIDIVAQGGTLNLPDGLTVDARGYSGSDQPGTGGTVSLRSLAGTLGQAGALTAGATVIEASGQVTPGFANGVAGTIDIASFGAGQSLTVTSFDVRAGSANGGPSGAITLTADNAPITVTNGANLITLGTLNIAATGAAGALNVGFGLSGTGNDVIVSHAGVAPASATTINANGIALEAGRDLLLNGAPTLRGAGVRLVGIRTIDGANASIFSTGDVQIGSGLSASLNGVRLRTIDANGLLMGYQGASSTTPEITTPAAFTVSERLRVGAGNIDIRAGTGIAIGDAGTGTTGTIALTSTTGAIGLRTAGTVVPGRPAGITITGTGSETFTALEATGPIAIQAGTGITGGSALTTAGAITLTSVGGPVTFTDLNAAGALDVTTPGAITGTSARTTTGPLGLGGGLGVTVPTVVSGGTTALNAANGAIRVATNLQSTGTITATGQSIFLRGLGPLTIATLNATAGDLDVASAGALSVTTPQATGAVTLASTGGGVTFGNTTAGAALTVNATGTIAGTSATATAGPITLTGNAGITVPTLTSGGNVALTAANGTITVATNLASAGRVSAAGRGVLLRSAGALSATSLTATAGNLDIGSGGALTVDTGQASAAVALQAATTLNYGTLGSGTTTTLTAGSDVTGGTLTATGTATITSGRQINVGATTASGLIATSNAAATFGTITTGAGGANLTLNGGVTTGNIGSVGTVSIANAAAGGITVGNVGVTAGSIALLNPLDTTAGAASGPLAGRTVTTGALTASADIQVQAKGTITIQSATAGNDVSAIAALDLRTGDLTAGRDLLAVAGATGNLGALIAGRDLAAITVAGFIPATTTVERPDLVRNLTVASARAGDDLIVSALGALRTGDLRTTGQGQDGTTIPSPPGFVGAVPDFPGAAIFARGSQGVTIGQVNAAGQAQLLNVARAFGGADFGSGSGGLTAGAVTAAAPVTIASDGSDATFTTVSGSAVTVTSGARAIGDTLTTTGGNLAVTAAGGAAFNRIDVTGNAQLAAPNGSVAIAADARATGNVDASGRAVTLRSLGALTTGNLIATAGAIDVQAVGNLTVGAVQATGAVTLASANLATVNGTVTGTTIAVNSADIALGQNARLGTLATTTQLTLTNSGATRTTIGGAGVTTGYSLSAAELARLAAGNITIVAPVIGGPAATVLNSARLPDVTIDSFTLAGGTNFGPAGTFGVQTGGKLRVIGAVNFTGLANTNTIALRGDEAVEILDAGRIALNGQAGLAGTLDLTSRNIVASTSGALADFAAAPDLTAISDRAARSEGTVDDGGWLQANTIRATLLNSTLIIQNIGVASLNPRNYADRRGFTVGTGGLTIVQGGTNPVNIAINGRQIGNTTPAGRPTIGGFITGIDLIPATAFQTQAAGQTGGAATVIRFDAAGVAQVGAVGAAGAGVPQFNLLSTINGCAIASPARCRADLSTDNPRDVIVNPQGTGFGDLRLPYLIELKDYTGFIDQPLIDEPVTGAANDDLWSVDDGKCDPSAEKCE